MNEPILNVQALRLTRLSPLCFVICLVATVGGLLISSIPWPEAVYFSLGSVVTAVLARLCLAYIPEWWWAAPALAIPWLTFGPLLEPSRVGLIAIPAVFLLFVGAPGLLFFGSLLRAFWREHRKVA